MAGRHRPGKKACPGRWCAGAKASSATDNSDEPSDPVHLQGCVAETVRRIRVGGQSLRSKHARQQDGGAPKSRSGRGTGASISRSESKIEQIGDFQATQ